MDLNNELINYYESDKYHDVIRIYENNKLKIINDKESMHYVIDSFVALKRFSEASKLINTIFPELISKAKTNKLTEEQKEELDFILELKIETLFNTKSYIKMLILLLKYSRYFVDQDSVCQYFKISKSKSYKWLFMVLVVVLLLTGIGAYLIRIGLIEQIYRVHFKNIGIIVLVVYFSLIGMVEILSGSLKKY